ncbi:MAG: leucine-rich repeat domain-containing protein [Clostridia bacterium]|nr:leucine-rich repeat domain-containing protein [Clostridia bacterium]
MKKKAVLIAVMLILALSCALVLNGCRLNIDLVSETPVEKNRLQYTLKSDGTYAVSGIPCKQDFFGRDIYEYGEKIYTTVRIPAKHEGIAVTEISDYAFNNWKFLKSIKIPDTITRIGNSAFKGCDQLKSLTLPKSVSEICEASFGNCPSLKKVEILNPSINIDHQAFKESNNIGNFKLKNGGKYLFSNGALIDSSTKTLVYLNENHDIPNDGSVEKLGDYLFYGRESLEEIVIPESVSAIGGHAFQECINLRSVVFLGDVYELGEWCFERCYKLEQINIEDLKVEEIQPWIFSGCKALNKVDLPGNIVKICDFAFSSTGIQEISFPESVSEIGEYAFGSCDQLKKVQLNNGISRIEEGAFAYCKKLTMISIPDNITYFGKDVFADASVSYYVDNNIKYLGNRGNNYLILVGAINTGLTEYEINSSTKIICDQAFSGCTELKEILIPKSVVYIGPEAFDKNVKIIRETEEPT